MKKFFFILLIALISVPVNLRSQDIGDPAPDFTYDVLSGGSFTLSDHLGKVVMIFVFGYNCGFCISGGPGIQSSLVSPYENNDEYVAIGIDTWNGSPAEVESFRDRTGLTMPLLMMGSQFAVDYDITYDRLMLIDQEGKIAFKGTGAGTDRSDVKSLTNELLGIVPNTLLSAEESNTYQLSIFPNPITDISFIQFNLPVSEDVNIQLTGLDGRVIDQPVNGYMQEGRHRIEINTSEYPSGIYFMKLTVNGKTQTLKLVK